MYKIVVFLFLLNSTFCWSQFAELTAFGGYTCRDRFSFSEGSGILHDSPSFGTSLAYFFEEETALKFDYLHQSTKANIYLYSGYQENNIPVNLDYFLLGVERDFIVNDKVLPYLELSVGMLSFHDRTGYNIANYKFAANLNVGLKIMLTKHLGFTSQIGLYMPIQFSGVTFTFGTGGSGIGFGTGTTVTQFAFSGGLVYRIIRY